MRVAVSAEEMKKIENETITHLGMDALVLMERAALKVAEHAKKYATKKDKILCVCGMGNNGGDGAAAARILRCQGYQSDILLIGSIEKASAQMKRQLYIAKNCQVPIFIEYPDEEYGVIVDAIFGIGFKGQVEGDFLQVIDAINDGSICSGRGRSKYKVISVDIPSGVNSDTGAVEGVAVYAEETVTFGEIKRGLLLYPGAEYAGVVDRADIGFSEFLIRKVCDETTYEYLTKDDVKNYLPVRKAYSNKGNYGKVLVIAGSTDAPGAAYLTAVAAYRMGTGLVKVFTTEEGMRIIEQMLPEVLVSSYQSEEIDKKLQDALLWADAVAIGPGLSTGDSARKILHLTIDQCKVPLILDADALNILSDQMNLFHNISGEEEGEQANELLQNRMDWLANYLPESTILTPHLKELSRLIARNVNEISQNLCNIADKCTENNDLVFVMKDARTMIVSGESRCINLTGNHGMATGGSGDVLTGVIASLAANGLPPVLAARLGVYMHGLAGDKAAEMCNKYSMLASDIINGLISILSEME